MVLRLNRMHVFLIIAAVISAVTVFGITAYAINANAKQAARVELPVVMYHQLTDKESKAGKYVLTFEQFEKDLIYLKEKGCQSVTSEQLIDFVYSKGTLPEKAVMITFDDGCESVYAYALPLLEKYGFTAVAFAVGAWVDRYSEIDDHNLSYSVLNWNEVAELVSGDVIDVQSHSYDCHSNAASRNGMQKKKSESLSEYSAFLSEDTAKMKERMLKYSGVAPVALAYPFGSFSPESDDILKSNGIKITFSCREIVSVIKKAEPDSLFGLGRFNRANGISSESFFEKMGIT